MQPTIEQEVRSFILHNFLFGREKTLGDDDSFLEKGIIDSTGLLELIAHLEQRYNITLDSHELVPENLDSVARLVKFVSGKLNGTKHVPPSDEGRNARALGAGQGS